MMRSRFKCLAFILALSGLTMWQEPARAQPIGQALVIGEATYASLPHLLGCALSANSMAAALRRLSFSVNQQTDASSGAIFAAIADFSGRVQANPQAPTAVYVCGYFMGFDNKAFLLPVSANLARPTDLLSQGILAKAVLDAVARAQRIGMLIFDAIPTPSDTSELALGHLAPLPPQIGYLIARDTVPDNQPTGLAAVLVPALHGPRVEAAKLLGDVQAQLAGLRTTQVLTVRLPQYGLYLANAPAPPSAAPPPPSPTAAAPTPADAPQLPAEEQMTQADRELVQRKLAGLGYYDGKVDGVFGPETRAAIRRWQHEIHAPMTGQLDAAQANKLVSG